MTVLVNRPPVRWLLVPIVCAALCGCGSPALRDGPGKDIRELLPVLEQNRPKPLLAGSWLPLVALSFRGFAEAGDTGDPTSLAAYPPGYVFKSLDAQGPIYMFHRSRESRYDRAASLYEIVESRNVVWRMWTGRRTLIRVPGGWREESRAEILFGVVPLGGRVTYLTDLPSADAAASGVAPDR